MNSYEFWAFVIGSLAIIGSVIAVAYFDYKQKKAAREIQIKNFGDLVGMLDEMFEKRGL